MYKVLFGFYAKWCMKAFILEEQQWYYLTNIWGNKGVHAFPKGITLKVNIIALLEFELTHGDVTVKHISNYAIKTARKFL